VSAVLSASLLSDNELATARASSFTTTKAIQLASPPRRVFKR
jgi:hypothetical protein